MAKLKISYNAPVVLSFAVAATVIHILTLLLGEVMRMWVVSYPSLGGVPSYLGLVTHILGHGNWDHLLSNFMMILLVGPILEERHGSKRLAVMIFVTALITGLFNLLLGQTYLLGASGIVFMMILLASMANVARGEIPLTFVLIAFLFLGREVVHAVTRDDGVSQMAHLVGGLTGAAFGFLVARRRAARPA